MEFKGITIFYLLLLLTYISCTSENSDISNSETSNPWFDYYYIEEFHTEPIIKEIDSLAYTNNPIKAYEKIDSILNKQTFDKNKFQYLKLRQYEIYNKFQLYTLTEPSISDIHKGDNDIINYYINFLTKYDDYINLKIDSIQVYSKLLKKRFSDNHHLYIDSKISEVEYYAFNYLRYRKALFGVKNLIEHYKSLGVTNLDLYWLTYLYAYTAFYSVENVLSICIIQDYFNTRSKNYKNTTFIKASLMMLLAENHYYVNHTKTSSEVFQEVLELIDKCQHPNIYQFCISKQLAYDSNMPKDQYLAKAQNIRREILHSEKDYININRYLALIHYDLNNIDSTIYYSNLALKTRYHNTPTTNAYKQGVDYLLFHNYSALGESDKALKHLIDYSFFNMSIDVPDLSNLISLITEDVLVSDLDYVNQGAKLYFNDYKFSGNRESLEMAIKFSKITLQNLNKWYKTNEEDALLHLYNIKREDAINTLIDGTHLKYLNNPSHSLIDSIYKYIHTSRGNILRNQKSIYQEATQFIDTDKYLNLLTQINEIKTTLNYSPSINYTNIYYDYKTLDDSLYTSNPILSKISESEYVSSNSLFNDFLIKENAISATYKVVNDSVYILTNDGIEKKIYKKSFDSNAIRSFYDIITNPNSSYAEYKSVNKNLYNSYIKTWITTSKRRRLILFPDLDFNSIPFTSFNMNENADNFSTCEFIGEKFSVTYSSTIINRQYINPNFNASTKLLMIPFLHTNKNSTIATLNYISDETKMISTIFENFVLKPIESNSINEFKQCLDSKSQIIHIAAHGQSNMYNKLENKILFTDNENENLYGYKFANLKIDVDLLVLSACDTNLGPYKKGESQYSLARYFSIAGAKNVISSKWKLPDFSAAEIIVYFYKSLIENADISNSLHSAKSQWLKSYIGFRHPYYWDSLQITEN